MTIEQTIMLELSTLPETRRADVLAFIRYLKLSIPTDQKELEERFDKALQSIRVQRKWILQRQTLRLKSVLCNKHLLDLENFRGIQIIKASEFIDLLKANTWNDGGAWKAV